MLLRNIRARRLKRRLLNHAGRAFRPCRTLTNRPPIGCHQSFAALNQQSGLPRPDTHGQPSAGWIPPAPVAALDWHSLIQFPSRFRFLEDFQN
jgi:hypothetical protein